MRSRSFSQIVITLITVLLLTPIASTLANTGYTDVDPQYLSKHMEEFNHQKIRTSGIVYFMASIFMYEDFWLQRAIPVVIRFAELPMPSEGDYIEIYGTIEYCELEGGFYYLKAEGYIKATAPEFSPTLIMPIVIIATLIAIITQNKILKNIKLSSKVENHFSKGKT